MSIQPAQPGIVAIYQPQNSLVLPTHIEVGEKRLQITAKNLIVNEDITISAKSIEIICKYIFVTLGLLDSEHLEVITEEAYLGGTITAEDDNIVVVAEIPPYYGDEKAIIGRQKIIQRIAQPIPLRSCTSSAREHFKV